MSDDAAWARTLLATIVEEALWPKPEAPDA